MGVYINKKGGYSNFAKILTIFDGVVEGAIGIEVHNERYTVPDSPLKNMYVLMGAFGTEDGIVPVLMEVKEFIDDRGNVLYLTVSMNEIKEADFITYAAPANNTENSYAPSASTYRIEDIFKNVNARDGSLLKYIPDKFLNEAQLEAKKAAFAEITKYINDKRFDCLK